MAGVQNFDVDADAGKARGRIEEGVATVAHLVEIAVDPEIGRALENEEELFFVAIAAGDVAAAAGRQAHMHQLETRQAGGAREIDEVAVDVPGDGRLPLDGLLELTPVAN